MAYRGGNFVVNNNNTSEEMPFLQPIRQTNFEILDELIDENLISNVDINSTSGDTLDTNANVDIHKTENELLLNPPRSRKSVDHQTTEDLDHKTTENLVSVTQITAEKCVTETPKKHSDHLINYENMYFDDEEIRVMGYASSEENVSECKDGQIQKRMPLLEPAATNTDLNGPCLVIGNCTQSITVCSKKDGNDIQSGTADPLSPDPKKDTTVKDLTSDPDSGVYPSKVEPRSSIARRPHLVGRCSRFRTDVGSSSENSAIRVPKSRRSGTCRHSGSSQNSGAQTLESGVLQSKSQLVNRRSGNVVDYPDLGPESESLSDSEDVQSTRSVSEVGKSGGTYSEEPIHMTLEEVRTSLRSLNGYLKSGTQPSESPCSRHQKLHKLRGRRIHFGLCSKPRQIGEGAERNCSRDPERGEGLDGPSKSLKHTLCNWFGIAKCSIPATIRGPSADGSAEGRLDGSSCAPIIHRALPPVPRRVDGSEDEEDGRLEIMVQTEQEHEEPIEALSPLKSSSGDSISDFASSIQKVKDCGWYWGPISGEMAEKVLGNEPDGSFILRDSSDEYYIFSLTFKLNGFVRHVRIEHEHGIFSFGTFTKFKSHTIVEFIENAVEHSRSGRYLFFIHRRPVLGPMRVQLLHPVSRFKQVQSLQHTCRFAILKVVRRDLIDALPIPERLKDYLNTPQYYTEQRMQDYQNHGEGGS